MGVDDASDIVGSVAELRQGVFEPGPAVRAFVLDTVDVDELVVLLVADAGVDEDQAVVVLDEQAAQRQRDAIAIVGRSAAGPERFGDDAEHGATVEVLEASLERMTREMADVEGCVGQLVSPRAAGPGSAGASTRPSECG